MSMVNIRTRFFAAVPTLTGLVLVPAAVLMLTSCCGRQGPGSHDHAAAGGCCPPAGHAPVRAQAEARPSGETNAPVLPPVAGHEHASAEPSQAKPAVLAQTTCPVMGGAINEAVFVEYQGQKVYFCCRGCDQRFQQDPKKYTAKLPQFQD